MIVLRHVNLSSHAAPDYRRSPGGRAARSPPLMLKPPKTIVLVGLMGAGKTSIGRRLAARLGLPFVDADSEIEVAAGRTIEEIFDSQGEAFFRDGERRVIARLLDDPVHVLATGGGAFLDERTRAKIRERAISIWVRARLDILVQRTARRSNRPLLKHGEPRQILAQLIAERHPVYAVADIIIDSEDGPADALVEHAIRELERYLGARADGAAPAGRAEGALP